MMIVVSNEYLLVVMVVGKNMMVALVGKSM